MHKLVTQIHNREDIPKGRPHVIEESCVMLFTKGNMNGIRKTLPQFLNLNALLQQIKDNGLMAIYRCPHCGGKLKVDKNVDISKLKVCKHCDSEIESMDLTDFLKTALS